jgi:hypothetical protein
MARRAMLRHLGGVSAMGQQPTFQHFRVMSASPLVADLKQTWPDVSSGPFADIKIGLSGPSLLRCAASDAMLLIIVRFLIRLTLLNCFEIDY